MQIAALVVPFSQKCLYVKNYNSKYRDLMTYKLKTTVKLLLIQQTECEVIEDSNLILIA